MDHLTQKMAALAIIAALLFFPATNLLAVSGPAEIPDSPAAPDDPDSAMFSLEDIFNRLDTGASGTRRDSAFIEPQTGPVSAGRNLDEVMAAAPVVDGTNGAGVVDVLAGKTFWGLLPGTGWGLLTGTLATRTPVNNTVSQQAGVYEAFNLSTVDPDLATANIKAGVTIFGVPGNANVVDTSAGTAVAGDMKSGTIAYVKGTAVTGTLATRTPANNTVNQQAGYYDAFVLSDVDPDLATANIKAGVTIFGVSGNANVVDTSTGTAVAGDMKSGTIAYVKGAAVTGTLATGTPDNATVEQEAGVYEAFNLSTVDTDLVAENIKKDVAIFGVIGTLVAGGSGAKVPQTGQTACYDLNGNVTACDQTGFQDGELRKGVAWPVPRFTDNNDGTVTDNLTGLIWLKNASCTDAAGGVDKSASQLAWAAALSWSSGLQSTLCGLNDGSIQGNWRLPNVRELHSLMDFGSVDPSLPSGHPFTGIQNGNYWSSTTRTGATGLAWLVSTIDGLMGMNGKANFNHVWPVRDELSATD